MDVCLFIQKFYLNFISDLFNYSLLFKLFIVYLIGLFIEQISHGLLLAFKKYIEVFNVDLMIF